MKSLPVSLYYTSGLGEVVAGYRQVLLLENLIHHYPLTK